MTTFTESTTVAAPRSEVWATLADIGTIAEWNEGLAGSHATNEVVGVGATRHCDISAKQTLEEEVVEYIEGERITFRITESTLPFARADIRFTLSGDGQTTAVAVSPDYKLKYGPLGSVMDVVMVKRRYRKGMRDLLGGLKRSIEPTDQPVD
jgi:uncharacterized protein YndB with AHSA1/START domain